MYLLSLEDRKNSLALWTCAEQTGLRCPKESIEQLRRAAVYFPYINNKSQDGCYYHIL